MFWGITLESGKKYTQVLERSFHLTMAALGFSNANPEPVSVLVDINQAQFVLCTLQAGKIPQQQLSLKFTEGEEVSFSIEGDGEVHLTGYLLPEPQEYEITSEDDEDQGEDFLLQTAHDEDDDADSSEDLTSDDEYVLPLIQNKKKKKEKSPDKQSTEVKVNDETKTHDKLNTHEYRNSKTKTSPDKNGKKENNNKNAEVEEVEEGNNSKKKTKRKKRQQESLTNPDVSSDSGMNTSDINNNTKTDALLHKKNRKRKK